MSSLRVLVFCDKCQMVSIQGVACHESGCPNELKKWSVEKTRWVRFLECGECGAQVESGQVCCS